MRTWLVFGLVLASCSSKSVPQSSIPIADEPPAPAPKAPVRGSQEYANARKAFKTTLTVSGPSPQHNPRETLPPDAEQMLFTSGELTLRSWVVPTDKSRDAKQHPAVLFLHGGFGFDTADWAMTKPFRDAGYIVMAPILRGENGQPGNFTFFYDEVDDVLAAAEKLASLPAVDSNRIFVTGHSAGGTLAMFAGMASTKFRAVAALSGTPDADVFPDEMLPFDRSRTEEIKMRSPLQFATSFQCPARLFVGAEEELFVESNLETAKRAKAAGLDVEAHTVAGDHQSMVIKAIPLAVAFFNDQK